MNRSTLFASAAVSVRSLSASLRTGRIALAVLSLTFCGMAAGTPMQAHASKAPANVEILLFDETFGIIDVTPTYDGHSVIDLRGNILPVCLDYSKQHVTDIHGDVIGLIDPSN